MLPGLVERDFSAQSLDLVHAKTSQAGQRFLLDLALRGNDTIDKEE